MTASLMDVPADGNIDTLRKAGQLPSDFHLPDLKPWGLSFQGARFLVVEGQPATQLFYTTDNQALGPLTVVVASSSKPDSRAHLRPPRRFEPALLAPSRA